MLPLHRRHGGDGGAEDRGQADNDDVDAKAPVGLFGFCLELIANPPALPVAAATAHYALCTLIQVQNFVLYRYRPSKHGVWGILLFLSEMLILRRDEVTMTVVLFLAGVGLTAPRALPARAMVALRAVYVSLVGLCLLYLAMDQVAFKTMFGHVRSADTEQAVDAAVIAKLWGSWLEEVDVVFVLNLLAVVGLVAYLLQLPSHRHHRRGPSPHTRLLVSGLALFVINTLACFGHGCTARTLKFATEGHALLVLISPAETSKHGQKSTDILVDDYEKLRFGQPKTMGASREIDLGAAAVVEQWRTTVKEARRRPNVIVIMMESCGAKQVLDGDGRAHAEMAPTIAAFQKNAITFARQYVYFPSTVHSHVSISTGGLTSTQGDINSQFTQNYTGPSLNRILKQRGYETALFAASDLNFESLDTWLEHQRFDKIHHYGTADDEFKSKHYLNSWGGDDHSIVNEAVAFAAQAAAANKPYFVYMMPDATHHPYSYPHKPMPSAATSGYELPDALKTRPSGLPETSGSLRYLQSLHYSDFCLKMLFDKLETGGLLDNTVVLIGGDHGEAFGDLHEGNLMHKSRLYEENVRSFMMLGLPKHRPAALGDAPLISRRAGELGDIAPTIVDLLGGDAHDFAKAGAPGRSLLTPWANWRERTHYFRKLAAPLQWGLVDGQWKFIADQIGSNVELYDLSNDANEQTNLAADPARKEQVQQYSKLCNSWYVMSHCKFVEKLNGYQQTPCKHVDMRSAGPKKAAFGYLDANNGNAFVQLERLHPGMSTVVIWEEWVPYPDGGNVVVDFAPRLLHEGRQHLKQVLPKEADLEHQLGSRTVIRFNLEPGWHTTWFSLHPKHMNDGEWSVITWDDTGSVKLLQSTVWVSRFANAKTAPMKELA